MTPQETLERIASHYHVRVGSTGIRIICPVHGERHSDPNCHVWVEQGRVAVQCHSRHCEPLDIYGALERILGEEVNPRDHQGRKWIYQATYTRTDGGGMPVWRVEHPDGSKEFPTAGSRDGVPVLKQGDPNTSGFAVVCEGEGKARAIARVGHLGVSYVGGSGCAGRADYSTLGKLPVLIWPDNDLPGLRAAIAAWYAIREQTGIEARILPPCGEPGSSWDAADLSPNERQDWIERKPCYDDPELFAAAYPEVGDQVQEPEPEQAPLRFRHITELIDDVPDAVWRLPYIAPSGVITLLVGDTGVGKSQLLWGMLSEIYGTGRCLGDHAIAPDRVEIITEERPVTVHDMAVRVHIPDYASAAERYPGIYILHHAERAPYLTWGDLINALGEQWSRQGPPGIFVVDTLGGWSGVRDMSDYGETVNAITPLGDLLATYPETACIVVHHARKAGGGRGADASIGSTGVPAMSDNVVLVTIPEDGDSLTRKLDLEGRLVQPGGDSVHLRWDPETGHYGRVAARAGVKSAIIALLTDGEYRSSKEIQDALADLYGGPTVYNAIPQLHAANEVDRTGAGKRGDPFRYGIYSHHP